MFWIHSPSAAHQGNPFRDWGRLSTRRMSGSLEQVYDIDDLLFRVVLNKIRPGGFAVITSEDPHRQLRETYT